VAALDYSGLARINAEASYDQTYHFVSTAVTNQDVC